MQILLIPFLLLTDSCEQSLTYKENQGLSLNLSGYQHLILQNRQTQLT